MRMRNFWLGCWGVVIGAVIGVPSVRAHVALQATLDTAQAVPPATGSSATGTASFALEESTGALEYHITVTGLSGDALAAHIHEGAVGVASNNIVVGFDATALEGTVTIPLDKVPLVLSGGTYVNVHTAQNVLGEIRGQVVLRHGTCDCRSLSRPEFKKCVVQAIKALSKDDRKLADIKALKRAAAVSACGRTKGPKKAIACCFESEAFSRAEGIVTGQLCAALPEKACTKKGGDSLGAGSSCFANGQYQNPCAPPASPSGAFLDPID